MPIQPENLTGFRKAFAEKNGYWPEPGDGMNEGVGAKMFEFVADWFDFDRLSPKYQAQAVADSHWLLEFLGVQRSVSVVNTTDADRIRRIAQRLLDR